MIYVLDTDHLSIRGRNNAEALTLQMRLNQIPAERISTTIINYEEQMRGWLEKAGMVTKTRLLKVQY